MNRCKGPIANAYVQSTVEAACRAIEEQGFAIIPNLISSHLAGKLARRALASPRSSPGHAGWEAFVAMLNHDITFAELVGHPTVLAIVRRLIGGRSVPAPNAFAWPEADQIRLMNCDALVAHPGSESGWWHLDPPMGQLSPARLVPDFPIVVNVMWMLTPFSKNNGATRVLPFSHLKRAVPPPTREPLNGELHVCGGAGSIAIIPNITWHAASPNRTKKDRVALACSYVPWWVNRLTLDSYPVTMETYQALPGVVQALTRHQLQWNMDFTNPTTKRRLKSPEAKDSSKLDRPSRR